MENQLLELFIEGLKLKASSKTRRYVFGKGDNWNDFVQKTVDVIFTLLVLRAKAKAVAVEVGDEYYMSEQYAAPSNLKLIIENGKVWATTDTILGPEAYTDPVLPKESFEYEQNSYTAKMLSPESVSKYFNEYNKEQSEEDSLNVSNISFEQKPVLTDFSGLMFDDSHFIKFVESGRLNENVAYFNGVLCPFKNLNLHSYSISSKEVLARWLVMK